MDEDFVDVHEPDWLKGFCKDELGCSEAGLDSGDIILGGRFVVERKEAGDFFKTMFGNRLEAQLMGLMEGGLRPVILIEGDPRDGLIYSRGNTKNILASYHGMAAKMAALGVSVVPVVDRQGTRQFLRKLAELSDTEEIGLEKPVTKVKTHGPEVSALAQVPGVGSATAEEIYEELGPIDQMVDLHLFELQEATGEKTAEHLWQLLHGEDVPKVYDKLGRGKRAQKLVEAYPEVERGDKVPRDLAEEVLGGWADHLGELLIEETGQ